MRSVLVRIPIPARLADEMLLKTAAAFDIPATAEGTAFVDTWKALPSGERDRVMKYAYDNNVSLLEAFAHEKPNTAE